jgi:hypothetical protein
MGKASHIDLAQRALNAVTITRDGYRVNFDDVTLKGIADAAADGAAGGAITGAIAGSFTGPGAAVTAFYGGLGGATWNGIKEVRDKTKLEKDQTDSFDLNYPGARSHFGEPGFDPGNPFGTDAGRRVFASDILRRAVQKDVEVRGGFNEAVTQKTAELRAQGIGFADANSQATEIVQKDLVDQIAAKVKAQFQNNMGFDPIPINAPRNTKGRPPEGILPSLLVPQRAMPEPALPPGSKSQENAAPATGDRPYPANAPDDGGDEFQPRTLPPGKRLYDSINPANLLKGLL